MSCCTKADDRVVVYGVCCKCAEGPTYGVCYKCAEWGLLGCLVLILCDQIPFGLDPV